MREREKQMEKERERESNRRKRGVCPRNTKIKIQIGTFKRAEQNREVRRGERQRRKIFRRESELTQIYR